VDESANPGPEGNRLLQAKYALIGRYYDLLDYPFERLVYRKWRPQLLEDLHGEVLEPGVGTGHNLGFYPSDAHVTGIDLSPAMLRCAEAKRARFSCEVELRVDDATELRTVATDHYDWVFSTFMCCVMPDELQPRCLAQFGRVLKSGGRFRLLEVVYSSDPVVRRWQERVESLTSRIYGARFDRETLAHIDAEPTLEVTEMRFLKWQSYLLIDGICTK
jgi:phosphatidylethanolamine/phosphatidyl-N-methylethanolamine N-methyltransferase